MYREESGVYNTCSDNLHVINCFYCLRCIQTCFTVYYCLVIVKTVDLFLVQTLHNLFYCKQSWNNKNITRQRDDINYFFITKLRREFIVHNCTDICIAVITVCTTYFCFSCVFFFPFFPSYATEISAFYVLQTENKLEGVPILLQALR